MSEIIPTARPLLILLILLKISAKPTVTFQLPLRSDPHTNFVVVIGKYYFYFKRRSIT